MHSDRLDDELRARPGAVPEPPARRDGDTAEGPIDVRRAVGNAALARALGRGVTPAAQRSGSGDPGGTELDQRTASEIQAARGGGQPLADDVRADMQGTLGVDLSAVRVHTDPRADALNRSVRAEAFTTGTDVFFRSGAYDPSSSGGRRLLAHELAHVAQQGRGEVEGGRISHPDDAHEVEARAVGDAVAAAPASAPPAAAVDRQAAPDGDEPTLDDVPDGAVARQDVPEEELEEEEPAAPA